MPRIPLRARQRWLVGGIAAAVLVQGLIFLALASGSSSSSSSSSSSAPAVGGSDGDRDAIDPGILRQVGPTTWTHPTRACRDARGTCVGLEDGACARGTIGDAEHFGCGSPELRCCLP